MLLEGELEELMELRKYIGNNGGIPTPIFFIWQLMEGKGKNPSYHWNRRGTWSLTEKGLGTSFITTTKNSLVKFQTDR